MLWLSKHARLRNNLSPHIDGRLTASQATALKAHLASCETCRRELEELRATATALNELPQAEAPRSFAITPEMLKRKAAARARPTPALGAGMRLAGAAVAVALAVILVGDLTVGGGGGSTREAASQPVEESRLAKVPGAMDTSKSGEAGAYAPPTGSADSSTTQSNAGAEVPCAPAAASPATGGAGGAAGGDSSAGRGAAETPATTATPQPAPSSTPTEPPTTAPDIAAICRNASGSVVAPVAPTTASPSAADTRLGAAGNAATTPAASESNENGGISTFRVAEIVLAAILVAILAGVILEAALRRRRIA